MIQCNRALLFLILSLFIFVNGRLSHAAIYGKIAGKVTDEQSKEGLAGANIILEGISTGATADLNGEYYIINVHPGEYTVIFSYVGYKTIIKKNVQVISNKTTIIDMQMQEAVLDGETVTVVAERPVIQKDLTATERVVSDSELKRSWVRTIPEVLETQTGIFQGTFRGSTNLETLYMIDNMSVNSGVVSDNYTNFNTTAIQEISVMTGGYNAEYGSARSAIINLIPKEATSGIHGTFLSRVRPPGIYHFGDNYYGEDTYEYQNFNLDYWTRESERSQSEFFGQNPDSLLSAWRNQIDPGDTLGNYHKRYETEYEGTVYGALSERLNFLVSGRFKNDLGRYPQALPYNPEFNIQGSMIYKLTPSVKLKFGGFIGGWESADFVDVNFNSLESAQESEWLRPLSIDEPFARAKFDPWGAIYRQWPELRRWRQGFMKWSQVLSEKTFYEVSLSYLHDNMDRSDRYGKVPDSLWSRKDDVMKMVNRFHELSYFHVFSKIRSEVYGFKSDFTSQITNRNLLKAGIGLDLFDFSYTSFMGVYEGGNRWNLLNVFDGRPYEGFIYLQDKIEYPGIIVNAGLRFDFFNQNRNAPANMFDPLAMQPTTTGHIAGQPLGIPGEPERKATKLQTAISPRIGISHPISENSVLHFSYGHFYQRPSWTKMFGFPFVNYTEDMNTVMDPYAAQITYMEEWQGWFGNAGMDYERTIQYELGVDNNLLDLLRMNVTGYYKDGSQEARVSTSLYPALRTATKAIMMNNSAYSDVRGVEIEMESRLNAPVNFGVSYDVYWSSRGEVGYRKLYEPGSEFIDSPRLSSSYEGYWNNYHKIKTWMDFYFPRNYGLEFLGFNPLSELGMNWYMWWRSGDPYTYHAPGDLSTEPNNRTWFNYYQVNLKITKGIWVGDFRLEAGLDVRNLFDWKFLRLLYDEDMDRWQQNPSLPKEQRLPREEFSNMPNEWQWYSYEVPPREMFFQLKVDF